MGQWTEEREISKIIFDTDVLIWYFRGNQKAKELLSATMYNDRHVSSLSVMELLQGSHDKRESKAIKDFLRLNVSRIIHPDEKISEKAILLIERHALSDGLRTVDALIASTALTDNASLATANYKHFKGIHNLDILRVEP